MAKLALLFSLLFFAPVSTVSALAQQSVKLKYTPLPNHGGVVVQLELGRGRRARFLLDTGTNVSVISKSLVDELGIETLAALDNGGKPLMMDGTQAKAVAIDRFNIGALSVQNEPFLVIDKERLKEVSPSIDGMLGNSFFLHRPVLFDFPKKEVTIWDSGPLSAKALRDRGFRSDADVPLLDPRGELKHAVAANLNNGTPDRLVIDTGSPVTIISKETAKKCGLKSGGRKETRCTVYGLLKLSFGRLTSMSLGGKKIVKSIEIAWADKLPSDIRPVLGLDILSKFRVLFDIPAHKISLMSPAGH